MPITQDRMLALIAAARFFQKTLNATKTDILDIIKQDHMTSKQRLEIIFAQLTDLSIPDKHMTTLYQEEAHFKANHKRNDNKRRYEQRRKMVHASVDFDKALEESMALAKPTPPPARPAYFDQPDDEAEEVISPELLARQLAEDNAGPARSPAEILEEGKAIAASIRGQEALGELVSHPDQILNKGDSFGLAPPPPPVIHSSTNNNTARKLTPQEIQEMADRNNAAGYGSEPL